GRRLSYFIRVIASGVGNVVGEDLDSEFRRDPRYANVERRSHVPLHKINLASGLGKPPTNVQLGHRCRDVAKIVSACVAEEARRRLNTSICSCAGASAVVCRRCPRTSSNSPRPSSTRSTTTNDAAEWRSVLLLAATVWNMTCVVQQRLDE